MVWLLLLLLWLSLLASLGLLLWEAYLWRQERQELRQQLQLLPRQVLSSLQGSVNQMKGQVGEYVTYLQLRSQYDRLLPVGGVVDFVGLKLDAEEGWVDFIDVKTDKARLSPEQRRFQDLVKAGRVRFLVIQTCTSTIS